MRMRKIYLVALSIILSSCGSSVNTQSSPTTLNQMVEFGKDIDTTVKLEDATTQPISIDDNQRINPQQIGVGQCIAPVNRPTYIPSNNRISATTVFTCVSAGVVSGDIILNILKSPSEITESKTTPFVANITSIQPKTITISTPCKSGLYKSQSLIYASNMGTTPRQSSITSEYDIYCKNVNQFEKSLDSIVTGIASHSWNDGPGDRVGHWKDFPKVGITSQAQLEQYVRNIIVGRYTTFAGRVKVKDTCQDGRIALYDTSKGVFTIYNPQESYSGSTYPTSITSFSC